MSREIVLHMHNVNTLQYIYIRTVHVERTEGAAGEGETEGRFIGLILLLSLRTHILRLTGLKAKGFKCVCVCV